MILSHHSHHQQQSTQTGRYAGGQEGDSRLEETDNKGYAAKGSSDLLKSA